MMTRKSLDEWLTLAYEDSADCPPPEVFLEAEWSVLSDEQRRAATAHTEICPACAAERDLARAFDRPGVAAAETDADVDELLAKINASAPSDQTAETRSEVERLLRFPAMAKVLSQPALGLAAAAVAVLVVGIVLQTRSAAPPTLPDLPVETVTRGGVVETIAPQGIVDALPETLTWEPVTGAALYRVRLMAIDDEVLWRGETSDVSVALPDEIRSRLQRAVVYFWQVEAFSESGARTAWSAAVEFQADPAVAEETR